jgi:antitoxin component of MazEF toxin-antitoxin module
MAQKTYKIQKMKTGNQPFVNLPKLLLEYTDFKIGDEVVIILVDRHLVISKALEE